MISKSKKPIYLNEFYIDGVLTLSFIGKKVPRDIQRLSGLRGFDLIVSIFRDGAFCYLDERERYERF